MTTLMPPRPESAPPLLERLEQALLPLINLVFLLLLFFIVAGQLTDTALPDLPDSPSAAPQPPRADLQLTGNGQWRVGTRTVTPDTVLEALAPLEPGATLHIAAAASTPMAELERLFKVLEHGGYDSVILLTESTP